MTLKNSNNVFKSQVIHVIKIIVKLSTFQPVEVVYIFLIIFASKLDMLFYSRIFPSSLNNKYTS